MPYPEKKERNEQIFHLIECGHTFAEVGELYRIHPTRVLQIYNAMFRKKVHKDGIKISGKSSDN